MLFFVFAVGLWKLAALSVTPRAADTRAAQTRVRLDLQARQEPPDQQEKQPRDRLPAQAESEAADARDEAKPDGGEDESGNPAEPEPSSGKKHSGEPSPDKQGENPPESYESQSLSASEKAEMRQEQPSNGSGKTETKAEPELMKEGPLTLQAISWADAPENRIAVINGKVCRQKERVNGYRIEVINPDDVHVTNGEKTWRLRFGIR